MADNAAGSERQDGRGQPDWSFVPDPDYDYSARRWRLCADRLLSHFASLYYYSDDVLFAGKGYICYDQSDYDAKVAPFSMLALGVEEEPIYQRNAYLVWEVGKPPDVVIDVATPSGAEYDLGPKRDMYANIGVRERWFLDGTGGDLYGEPLVGEYLSGGEYHRYELQADARGRLLAHSLTLGVAICWDGKDFLALDPLKNAEAKRTREETLPDPRHSEVVKARIEYLDAPIERLRKRESERQDAASGRL